MKWILTGVTLLCLGVAARGAESFRVFAAGGNGGAVPQTQHMTPEKEYAEWTLEPGEPGLAIGAEKLVLEVFLEQQAPSNVQSLAYLVDREGRWFQSLQVAPLTPGVTNRVEIAMGADAPNWQPYGHTAAWQYHTRKGPKEIGLRFFTRTPWTGDCVLLSAVIDKEQRQFWKAPQITQLRAKPEAAAREMYEARFQLPDRYADPFDPAQIDVTATFRAPDGRELAVNGFYYQNHFRIPGEVYDRIAPQGRGEWRARFAFDQPGEWTAQLRVKDTCGETESEPWTVRVTDSAAPQNIRVSKTDPRYFETTDGAFFYPIGHNIRSPFDTRMDDQFPFRHRHDEGTTVYKRYFKDMQAAGENLAEVWMCGWSLGLEWSPAIPGYFGAGDYNLANAWEMDDVLRWAREAGLRINFVLNNHGRVSEWCDPEWRDHPYNRRQNGWLDRANDFFSDARSIDHQKRLYRYTVARWGWDSTIFAWELMSELDLVGNESEHYRRPAVLEWHRVMANAIREYDLGRHLVSTHFSTDHNKLTDEFGNLKELDFHGLDAYHNGQPENIVNLIVSSCRAVERYNKPSVINEFGGSPLAASLADLRRELHAALWSSSASTLAGTPLFWWWHVIDENNLYPLYTRVANFMKGVDKRDPNLKLANPQVDMLNVDGRKPQPRVEAVCIASPGQAVGWLWVREAYARNTWDSKDFDIYGVKVTLSGFSNTTYRVSYWNTQTGEEIERKRLRPDDGRLELYPPAFTRDSAFKIFPAINDAD